MSDERYAKWSALVDAETGGAVLTKDERAFCEGVEADSPLARAEAELVGQLRASGAAERPDSATRAIVDGALSRLRTDASHADAGPVSRRGQARGWAGLPLVGGLATGLCVAIAGLVWLPRWLNEPAPTAPPFRAELVYTSGAVEVTLGEDTDGSVLSPGTTVTTGEGRACLVLDPGIDVCAGRDSRLTIAQPTATERGILLERGVVTASLSPQPPGTHFAIRAGDVTATALGTVFSVQRGEPSQGVETVVSEGVVAVRRAGQEVRVRAHERVRTRGSAEQVVTSVSRMEEAHLRASLVVAELWHGDLSSTLEVLASDREVVKLDGKPIGTSPLTAVVPAGHRTVSVGDRPPRTLDLTAGERVRIRFEPPAAAPPHAEAPVAEDDARPAATAMPRRTSPAALRTTTRASSLSAGTRLRRAREHTVARRFESAVREYEALRHQYPSAPEAHAALVTLSELRLSNLGQARSALAGFEQYLRRGGPLAHEALHGKVRALRALGQTQQEARAIGQLLSRYPATPHRAQLEARRAELSRADLRE